MIGIGPFGLVTSSIMMPEEDIILLVDVTPVADQAT